jgi:hypothetical protein
MPKKTPTKKKPTLRRKAATKRAPSYQDKIKAAFANGATTISKPALAKIAGCDVDAISIAVSILRNPKRTKDPLNVVWNCDEQVFRVEGAR